MTTSIMEPTIMIFDIETTGLPKTISYGVYYPYNDLSKYDSSRIVQISMMLCTKNFEKISIENFIIKPENFKINNSDMHGITDDIAQKDGVAFNIVADTLFKKINIIYNCS